MPQVVAVYTALFLRFLRRHFLLFVFIFSVLMPFRHRQLQRESTSLIIIFLRRVDCPTTHATRHGWQCAVLVRATWSHSALAYPSGAADSPFQGRFSPGYLLSFFLFIYYLCIFIKWLPSPNTTRGVCIAPKRLTFTFFCFRDIEAFVGGYVLRLAIMLKLACWNSGSEFISYVTWLSQS